jgi:hypothetical protein
LYEIPSHIYILYTMKNTLIILVLLVISLTGCKMTVPEANTTTAQVVSSKPKLRLLHIAIGIDRTGSKIDNKVPDMTLEQIRTLATGLQQRGGDLRITTICSDSDKAMLRLKFDTPVQPPSVSSTGNVFEDAKLQEEYKTTKAQFDRQQQTKTTADKAQLTNFLQQVSPLLKQPATCAASDMIGIVQRSDLFLHERQPTGSDNPHKVLFLVTDGQHTSSKAKQVPELQSKAEVVVVSGGQGAGIFEPLKPVKFDSIDAAITYILSH